MTGIFLVAYLSSRYIMYLWAVSILLIVAGIIAVVIQIRIRRRLDKEEAELELFQTQNVELDFVLKAMKMATWRVELPSRRIAIVNDFRDKMDCNVVPPDATIDDVLQTISEKDRSRVTQAVYALMEGKVTEFNEQYRMVITHTEKCYWEESFATVADRDQEGQPTLIVGTSLRIDDRKEMENAMFAARDKAEKSERLKSAFLANISHEIRTPLNAIIGFADILPKVTDEEERNGIYAIMHENNEKLLHLIDDLVNVSKVESGTTALHVSTFDLNIVIRELVDDYQVQATANKLALEMDLAMDAMTIVSDRGRVKEILTHFLGNALKFTRRGSIVVGYDNVRNGYVRLWVRDTGKGIPRADQERIFNRFVKLDDFVPGTGLGLALSRSLAFSLNGTVGVESQVDVGSLFWAEIPVDGITPPRKNG